MKNGFTLIKKLMKKGFTLIEILTATSIMTLLFGIGMIRYNEFNQTQTLKQTALKLKNDLRMVQNKALAGEKPALGCTVLDGYKVTFTATTYQYQATCSPAALGPATTYSLPASVSFSSYPSSIIFKVLGQGVNAAGTICLAGFSKYYKLVVTVSGEITDNGFVGSCP